MAQTPSFHKRSFSPILNEISFFLIRWGLAFQDTVQHIPTWHRISTRIIYRLKSSINNCKNYFLRLFPRKHAKPTTPTSLAAFNSAIDEAEDEKYYKLTSVFQKSNDWRQRLQPPTHACLQSIQ